MKAAVFHAAEDVRIEELPRPTIGNGEALMRVRSVGVCSGDLMAWYTERKAPAVLGHEVAGEIVEVGKDVRGVRTGDRMFVHHHAPCFNCPRCRRGDYVHCDIWKSSGIHPGGMAEFIRIPPVNLDHDAIELDGDLSFDDGTLVEPLACVLKGIRRAGVRQEDTVLVMGCGVMGQLHVLALRKFGVGRIIAADRVGFRLRFAQGLGADDIINVDETDLREAVMGLTGGEGARVVVVGPPDGKAMVEGIGCAAPGGTVLFFSPARPGQRLRIDPNALYFKDISLVTSYSCGPADTADAMEMILGGVVRADKLVTHRYPLDEAGEAFAAAARLDEAIKVLIQP